MFDLLIKNGTIIDGSGKNRYKADLGVKRDKIQKIDLLKNARAKKVIDANGFFVTPGFVDILNHSDSYLTLLTLPTMDSMVHQGVTTVIGGNCGSSLAPLAPKYTMVEIAKMAFYRANLIMPPSKGGNLIYSVRKWGDISGVNISWITLDEFLAEIKKRKISINFGTLVGHSTIRRGIVGDQIRDLTSEELKIFQNTLRDALDQGALGVSLGLTYSHAGFVKSKELHNLAQILQKQKKPYTIHLRDEGPLVWESVKEAEEIAEKNNISIEISHLKISDKRFWYKMDKILELIEKANSRGVKINFDIYPYTCAFLVLYACLPKWIARGGQKKFLERLADKKLRPKIIEAINKSYYKFNDFVVAYSPHNKIFVGRKLADIASDKGFSVAEIIIDLLISSKGHLVCFSNPDLIDSENLKKAICHKQSIISSAGAAYNLAYLREEQLVHPRCFGTFPKFLKEYVRQRKLLSWEQAIQKITSMPCAKLGLKKRGIVREGFKADLVILDPNQIADLATFENPYQYPRGIKYVLVNGKIVISQEKHTNVLAGEIIKN